MTGDVTAAAPKDTRAATNPLFGDNRLKLGIFAHNGSGGAHTVAPEAYAVTWAQSLELSRAADAAGFEAIVPFGRWKGYVEGDPEHRSHECIEPYTWAAAIAQATRQAAIFTTTHVSTIHPLLAAKQATTIDLVSGGRFAMNVVAGWQANEFKMFGTPLAAHADRYAQAAEWLTLIKRFWTEDAEFDFEGDFYRAERAITRPRPVQLPHPPVMNAGSSAAGRRFAAEHADIAFLVLVDNDIETCRAQIAEYRDLAAREYGRELQVWAYTYVIQRDSAAEAEAYERYLADHADKPALETWMNGLGSMQGVPEEIVALLRHRSIVGMGGYPLVGTAEQISERMALLADAGLDGVLLTWVDYADGLARFNADVLPRLEHSGLRAPARQEGTTDDRA
jgi:alkanesulfonate monooxygenase SsuD/methylene tetrahydromethanopterin reductase-like flavin-dependent oxidoreductase (luciferase family)